MKLQKAFGVIVLDAVDGVVVVAGYVVVALVALGLALAVGLGVRFVALAGGHAGAVGSNGDFPFVHEVARHHAGVRGRHFQWVGVTRGRADGEAATSYVDLGQDRQANQKAAGPTHTLRKGATAHGEPAA